MNKKDEIKDLIYTENPQIVCFSEFGASKEVKDEEINIPGYSIYRGDSTDGRGGPGKGVAMYIHNSLQHSPCPQMDNSTFDYSSWCVIRLNNNDTLLVGVVYRSPNSTENNNNELLNLLIATKSV